MVRIGRVSLLVLLLVFGGFASFGQDFIRLWAGQDFEKAWAVALLVMLVYTLPLSQTFANQLLEARGLFAFKAKVYLLMLPMGVLMGYFLLPGLGVLGMAVGISTGWGIALVIMNVYYQRVIGLDMPNFFRSLAHGIAPVFVICLFAGLLMAKLPLAGWLGLFIQIVLFTALYAGLMYQFGMNAEERGEVNLLARRFNWIRA
jgi:O-antigen/teichoic acid export membrane protein